MYIKWIWNWWCEFYTAQYLYTIISVCYVKCTYMHTNFVMYLECTCYLYLEYEQNIIIILLLARVVWVKVVGWVSFSSSSWVLTGKLQQNLYRVQYMSSLRWIWLTILGHGVYSNGLPIIILLYNLEATKRYYWLTNVNYEQIKNKSFFYNLMPSLQGIWLISTKKGMS